jgi:hypothetical protein
MVFEIGELETESWFADAAMGVLRLGLGPPVRGRVGCTAAAGIAAAAAADDDNCIAMRVLGDLGGRAAAYRMPVYILTGAVTCDASAAKSGPTAATAEASGLLLMILATFFNASISARIRSC